METFAFIMIGICIVGLLWCVAGIIQVHRFANHLLKCIDDAYENRVDGNKVPWPDVRASYDNLKWYNILDHRFSKMIVYEKD